MTSHVDAGRADGHMQISEVAERVQLSHRTIRYYDDEGLLVPARSAGNYRLYSEADVQRLLLIRVMKPLGFSLEDMRQLITTLSSIDSGDDVDPRATARILSEFLATAKRYREKMARSLESADTWIADLEELARGVGEGTTAD